LKRVSATANANVLFAKTKENSGVAKK